MEATAVAGGGGGPAPFLIKTYEMVDDSSTDDMVSWSPASNTSFVVWNPADFAANLLPTYFKHNNFSSFIRQLNTYGFRKIDPERWEFANEDFIKDHKHLLKNIHRRKPIHSHSTHPPGSGSGSSSGASALLLADSERIALEEEIDRLSREKVALTADLWRFTQQQSGTKNQLEDMERRLYDMEQRQAKMIAFLETALRNPRFVHNLIKMTGGSGDPAAVATDFSIILHKKRRLPGDCFLDIATTAAERSSSFYDISSNNSSCSSAAASNMMADTGQVFNQDFCDKLSLGLYPAAVSESNNLVTPSIQSSGSSREEHNSNGNGRLECLSFVPDTLELSDTGTSLCPRKDSFFSRPVDDGDGLISFHLNLTLASSAMQIDKSDTLSRTQNSVPEEAIGDKEEEEEEEEDTDKEVATENETSAADRSENARPLKEATTQTSNQGPPGAPGRVNDLFWEQFLTERPGSSDAEEASSSLREDPSDDSQEERKVGDDNGMWKNSKDMEKLTL